MEPLGQKKKKRYIGTYVLSNEHVGGGKEHAEQKVNESITSNKSVRLTSQLL